MKAMNEAETVPKGELPCDAEGMPAEPELQSPSPTADPQSPAATRAAYADLLAAPSRETRRLIIGQALRGWDFDQPVDQPLTALTAAGWPRPALVEVDLTDFGVTAAHDTELVTALASHAARGGLLSFSHHAGNPFTGGDAWDRAGVDLAELADPTNPDTPAATAWQRELDRIADVMSRFADAVVLFRPLHESNGDWFWWGRSDPAQFRAVWKGLFNYLTQEKGLHNLLWVYSANRYLGDPQSDPLLRYPGDALVDIVGLDVYDDDLINVEPGYAALTTLGKPFGLTEYGAANWPAMHDGAVALPNDKVMALIRSSYPAAVLATAWYSSGGNNWQISDKPQPAALLLDRWAVTLL